MSILTKAIERVIKVADSHYGLNDELRDSMRIVAKEAHNNNNDIDEIKVVKTSNTRLHTVFIDGGDFGDFDELETGTFSYFPKKQDRLTGDHYIAIGKALNELNKTN